MVLSERMRLLLTNAAYLHLKHLDVFKHTRNLSPASRAILLSEPAESYQQALPKALAHHFEAKLLLLDMTDFSLKMQSKYGSTRKNISNWPSSLVETVNRGKVVICGLRNGAIMLVDTLQNQRSRADKSSKTSMPSSVCCLTTLHLWDQYYLASSMDGSIKLFDQHLIQRGPIQSYEGNVNSDSRIELLVDPSEKVVKSGGEDCYMCLWDIKSGKLLFREKFMNSVPTAVCWPRRTAAGGGEDYRNYWQDHSLGVFVGSYDAIYCMDWL